MSLSIKTISCITLKDPVDQDNSANITVTSVNCSKHDFQNTSKSEQKSSSADKDTGNEKNEQIVEKPVAYTRRFYMLFLFTVLSVFIGLMYTEYSTMANVTACYYNVTQDAVAWTNSASNLIYAVMVFPATSVMERMDLKWTIVSGAALNTVASVLQFLTLTPDSFAVVMASVVFSSLASVTVLATPPIVASKWFPEHEQSRACAVGVAGYQFGMSMGSLFPLVISSQCSKPHLITEGKWTVTIFLTATNAAILLLLLLTFQNMPPTPPNVHIQKVKSGASQYSPKVILNLVQNKDFLLIVIVNAIFVAVFCAVLTNLNTLVLLYFPHSEIHIGWMGFLLSTAGTMQGFVIGYITDRIHRYKELSIVVSVLCLVFHVTFSSMLNINAIWVQYITVFFLGFSVAGTLTLGYEYLLEVTYPQSEVLSTNVFTGIGLLFAVILTQLATVTLDKAGPIYSNGLLACTLLVACVLTPFISTDYKRLKSAKLAKEETKA